MYDVIAELSLVRENEQKRGAFRWKGPDIEGDFSGGFCPPRSFMRLWGANGVLFHVLVLFMVMHGSAWFCTVSVLSWHSHRVHTKRTQ